MATVRTEKTFFMGQEYQYKLTVTGDGEFRAWFPKEVADELDRKYATGMTKKEAEDNHAKELKAFEELHKDRKRVIAVEFKMTQPTIENVFHSSRYAIKGYHKKAIGFSRGHGFCLAVCEYTEEETKPVGSKKYYKYVDVKEQPYPDGSVSRGIITGWKLGSRPEGVYDWTQELEDMLCDMLQKTVNLSAQLLQLTHVNNIEKVALDYSGLQLLGAKEQG